MLESETYFFRDVLLNVWFVDHSINIIWEMTRDAGSQAYFPDLLNQNLHGNRSSGDLIGILKLESATLENGSQPWLHIMLT